MIGVVSVDPRWKRLSVAIEAERKRQRVSWSALARAGGLSPRTLFDLRNARASQYHADTLDRLESALRWESGSVERVLRGRPPIRKQDLEWARIEQAWPDLPLSVRQLLANIAESMRE